MKKLLLLAIVFSLFYSLSAQNLKIFLNYNTFCTDKLEPYVELTFLINGKSVNYVLNENQKFQAEVEVKVEFEKDDSVVNTLHYIIVSEEYKDTILTNRQNFADIQNVKLPNGKYFLNFEIKDVNNPDFPVKYIDNIEIYFPDNKVSSSGIQLLKDIKPADKTDFFVKYGYSMTPLYENFVPERMELLPYMTEIYNTDKILGDSSVFLVKSHIENFGNQPNYFSPITVFNEVKAAPITIFVNQLDIKSLPSGNYNLVVELMTVDSTVLAYHSIFFQRSNPKIQLEISNFDNVNISNSFVSRIQNQETLQEYVSCLYPIGNRMEQEFFNTRVKTIPFDKLQNFFYSFWIKRNPTDPEGAWLEYYNKVKYVQSTYGNKTIKGYRTDRGRVYLQYGPPTNITESPYKSTTYPYEIWHYYYVDGQSNVKFIFYNKDLVSNDYDLLHSDKTGEIRDPAWQMKLVKHHDPLENSDTKKPDDFWGNDMDENWRNP